MYSRARPGLTLFLDDAERQLFLRLTARAVATRKWGCLSYCLMGTHFHLVLRTPAPDLDEGMQRLLSTYATRLHEQRGTRGPVFGGRYGAQLLASDEHLMEVLRYVALNPVRGGLCRQPGQWPWSSHRALAGAAGGGLVAVVEVHQLIEAVTGIGGPEGYLGLVRQARGAEHVLDEPAACGSPQLRPARRPLSELLVPDDPRTIAEAHHEHGYSLRRIAAELDLNVSTVSRRLRRLGDPRRATQRV